MTKKTHRCVIQNLKKKTFNVTSYAVTAMGPVLGCDLLSAGMSADCLTSS